MAARSRYPASPAANDARKGPGGRLGKGVRVHCLARELSRQLSYSVQRTPRARRATLGDMGVNPRGVQISVPE